MTSSARNWGRRGRVLVSAALTVLLTLAVAVAAAWAVWRLAAAPLAEIALLADRDPAGLTRLSLQELLTAASAGALLACTAWLLTGVLLAVLADLTQLGHRGHAGHPGHPGHPGGRAPGRDSDRLGRLAERTCPAAVRAVVHRVLGATAGAAVATGLATAPAATGAADVALAAGVPAPSPARLAGLAVPDRIPGAAAPTEPATRSAPPRDRPRVLVRPGDCLWTITVGLLPAGATDREITVGWHRLRAANLARLGPDPDLVLPGTRLVVPDLTTPSRKAVS